MNFKITDKAKSEFDFYQNSKLDMIGHSVGVESISVPDGCSALECWWAKDTHGKILACREADLLSKVIRSKKSVNLQIKLWAEDMADGMILTQSELVEYVHGWPSWVMTAVIEQAGKIALEKIGFIPRFARAECLKENLWTPHMDRFDPEI